MKVVIVGDSGAKASSSCCERIIFAGVDPVNLDADYKSIEDVPLADYDTAQHLRA